MNQATVNPNVTVVTGQQIGLLGGPLYTVYKVLGAVFLARKWNGKAVYWLETNDADFNEINHIDYLDAEGRLRTLTWDIDSRGFSCGHIDVDHSLVDLLKTFFAAIRQTEFTPALQAIALDAYAEGRSLADASERLASHLFQHFGLELFVPFHLPFVEFIQPTLRMEAERTPDGEQCNCFCMIGKQRKALFRKGHGFQLRDGSPVDIGAFPLVPNVKTRSVCQDAYFNTHTYVAGPGEVKYLAELDPFFQFHHVKKEAVQPRMSITLIEPRIRRLLNKTGITLEDVLGATKEELLKKAITTGTGYDLKNAQKEADSITLEFLGKLRALGLDEKDMKSVGKNVREEVKNAFGRLRAKEKEKQDDRLRDIASLSENLMPFGQRQERVFNIFYYMNLYGGKDFIDWLYAHYDFEIQSLEIEHGK
jgi:uncharacterized protein YllA (UPF0747 family)